MPEDRTSTTTMSDVARAAGVSVMTVSNVINGRPRVGVDTKRRVLAVIEELGYQVNLTARQLRAGRSDSIALIVPMLNATYFAELSGDFARRLEEDSRHLVVAQSDASREGELSALSQARLQLYDAVILSSVGLSYDELNAIRTSQPIVLLGEKTVPPRFDHVATANVEGARLATQHLLDRGSRRVVIAGGSFADRSPVDRAKDATSVLRTEGWRLAHEELGRVPDGDLVLGDARYGSHDARTAVRRAVAQGLEFDAVFAITDEIAFGVLAGLRDANLRVPEDVRVVGFDALPIGEFTSPRLTSIDPMRSWIVDSAVSLLERRIAGDDGPPEHLTAPVRLVERESSR